MELWQAELLLSSENSNVEYKLKALITFADSLVDGQEYRRAIVSDLFIKCTRLHWLLHWQILFSCVQPLCVCMGGCVCMHACGIHTH